MNYGKQPVYRSGARSAAQARNLLNAVVVGDHVRRVAVQSDPNQGVIVLDAEQGIYGAESKKFKGWYYPVQQFSWGWWCSQGHPVGDAECIAMVQAFIARAVA